MEIKRKDIRLDENTRKLLWGEEACKRGQERRFNGEGSEEEEELETDRMGGQR